MRRSVLISLTGVVLGFAFFGGPVLAQEARHHDEMVSKIEAKREEIRRHTAAMEAIDDSEALQQEMQKHFRMTEELLGWVVEHQKQRLAGDAPPAQTAPDESAPTSGGMGHERMGQNTGSKAGMGHGKKGKSSAMAMGGMKKEDNGKHGGMSMGGAADSSAPTSGASAAAARIAERESLLQEITTHSLYLEGLTDSRERARETVKHQQMHDRLMTLMQE